MTSKQQTGSRALIHMARRHIHEARAERAEGGKPNIARALQSAARLRRMAGNVAIIERPYGLALAEGEKEQARIEEEEMLNAEIQKDEVANALIDTGQLAPQPNWSREFCVAIARQYYGRHGAAADVDDLAARLIVYCQSLANVNKTEGQRYYEAAHEEAIAGTNDTYAPWDTLTDAERQTQEECARVLSIALAAYETAYGAGEPDVFERGRWIAATEFVIRMWLSLGINSPDEALKEESRWLALWLSGRSEALSPANAGRRKKLLGAIVRTYSKVAGEVSTAEGA